MREFIPKFIVVAILSIVNILAQAQTEAIMIPGTNGNTSSSDPQAFASYHGDIYFEARDFYGPGWWKSDGTEPGTELISRKYQPYYSTVFNDRIIFLGYDTNTSEGGLWISDGTEEGTQYITDITNFPAGPLFTVVGDSMFMRLYRGTSELWVTGGNPENTHRVSSPGGDLTNPDHLTAVGDLLYFTAVHSAYGAVPWCSDGSTTSTNMLAETPSSISAPYGYCQRGDKVLFLADSLGNSAIYTTDGSREGTSPVVLIPGGMSLPHSSSLDEYLRNMVEVGDTLYFALENQSSGMRDIYALYPDNSLVPVQEFNNSDMLYLVQLHGLQDNVLARVEYIPGRQAYLMRINGAGAVYFDTIQNTSYFSELRYTQVCDTILYFIAAYRIYATDGTETIQLAQNGLSFVSNPEGFKVLGDLVCYSGYNEITSYEPWVHNMGTGEYHMLKDINVSTGGQMGTIFPFGNDWFFKTATPDQGMELWILHPETASTSIVKDIFPGSESSNPRQFVIFQDELYFTATGETRQKTNGVDLSAKIWKTDGTSEGTEEVLDLVTGYGASTNYGDYLGSEKVELGGKFVFGASVPDQAQLDVEPYISDGTSEGTQMILNINTEYTGMNGYSNPVALTRVGDLIYFAAEKPSLGAEPWVTDGTAAGTHLVKDIYTGPNGSLGSYNNFTAFGDKLVFTPFTFDQGYELWISDGSEVGTTPLTSLEENNSYFHNLTYINGKLVFWVTEVYMSAPRTLWATDGTVQGTVPLRDYDVKNWYAINEEPLGIFNNKLYFRGWDEDHGFELWESDGTTGGTKMVKDLYEGTEHGMPSGFGKNDSCFYFVARNGWEEALLWKSDGTPEGTYTVEGWDAQAMTGHQNLTVVGDYLYFSANDPQLGLGLFRFRVANSTGMEEDLTTGLRILPNPAYDFLYVGFPDECKDGGTLSLFDQTGRIVMIKDIARGMVSIELDVAGFERGLYFLRLNDGSELFSAKLILH